MANHLIIHCPVSNGSEYLWFKVQEAKTCYFNTYNIPAVLKHQGSVSTMDERNICTNADCLLWWAQDCVLSSFATSCSQWINFLNRCLRCQETHFSHQVFLALLWRHNGHDSVSNHQANGCLLNRLFRHRSKKSSKLRVTGLCAGKSPYKGPVTRKMFPFDDVIMGWAVLFYIRQKHCMKVEWQVWGQCKTVNSDILIIFTDCIHLHRWLIYISESPYEIDGHGSNWSNSIFIYKHVNFGLMCQFFEINMYPTK